MTQHLGFKWALGIQTKAVKLVWGNDLLRLPTRYNVVTPGKTVLLRDCLLWVTLGPWVGLSAGEGPKLIDREDLVHCVQGVLNCIEKRNGTEHRQVTM